MLDIPRKCLHVFAIFVETYSPFFLYQGKNISFYGRVQSKKLVRGIVCEEGFVIVTEKKQNHNPFSQGQNAGGSPGHVCSSGILEYSSLFIFFFTILQTSCKVMHACARVLDLALLAIYSFSSLLFFSLVNSGLPVLLSCGQNCR